MLKIGTRGSLLARAQTQWVQAKILEHLPGTKIEVKIIKTSADKDTKSSIRAGSSTGVFVREIEEALLSSKIDLAVHSMKDLPTRSHEALEIAAVPAREDPRDALIAGEGVRSLAALPRSAVIGTGSVRRQAQVLALRPDLIAKDIRGNVQTRLQKLASGDYHAILLACAGLNRLGEQGRISQIFEMSEMLPAPGQGALALQIRKGDERIARIVAHLHDPEAAVCVFAERAFLRRMGGGCNSPIAVHARIVEGACEIDGLVATPDGSRVLRDKVQCRTETAEDSGIALAEKLLAIGGAEILRPLH